MNILRLPETKVVLSLLLMLAGLELALRPFEGRLSKDVLHIRSMPQVAARVVEAPQETLKVLIVGNSLSRDGIDQPLLKEGLARLTGRPVEIFAMYPDGSSISPWLYGYRRYFSQTGAAPDLLLLCTGRTHLLDNLSDPGRVAAFYTSVQDMPHLIQHQAGDVEAMSKVLLSRVSMLFANRDRVQPLLFYNLVPGYEQTAQMLSTQRSDSAPTDAPQAPSAPVAEAEKTPAAPVEQNASWHYSTELRQMLKTLHEDQVQALIVAIPTPKLYLLPSVVRTAAQEENTPLLAKGGVMSFPAARFPDGYHLDSEGSAAFTRSLLEEISQVPDLVTKLSKPEPGQDR